MKDYNKYFSKKYQSELEALMQRWDKRAIDWDQNLKDPNHYTNFEKSYERTDLFTQKMLTQYTDNKNIRSLTAIDLGCGTGESTRKLLRYAGKVWGIDLSPKMIGIANRKDMDVKFQVENVLIMNYPTNHFDILISRGIMISHIPYGSQEIAIKEIARIAKPGALIVYDYLHDLTTRQEFLNYSAKKASYDKRGMTKLLKTCGILGKYIFSGEAHERVNRVAIILDDKKYEKNLFCNDK